MTQTNNLVLNAQRLDPTQTTMLRRQAISLLRARFNQLKKYDTYPKSTVESVISGYLGSLTPITQFAFTTGVRRSFREARRGLIATGGNIEGRQAEFMTLMSGMINAQSHDLADRIHTELQNTSSDLSTRISRVIADGKATDLPQQQVRRLIKQEIDKGFNKAVRILQTEITRSHAEGQLAAYDRLGVQRVGVLVEWKCSDLGTTAKGNPSPCKVCKPMSGVTFTLREAKGLIPRHPNCMCSFHLVASRTAEQIRQKREVERAIKRSVRAEGKQTTWRGAKRKIARRR